MAAHSAGTRAIPPVPNDQPQPAWDQWLRDMAQSLNLISLWVGTANGPSYQAGSGIAIDNGTTPPTISTAVPYAPLASPVFTGVPSAPTPATGDSSTALATTAFVKGQSYVTGGPYLPLTGGTINGPL